MSYSVEIVADSVGPNGARLTTFALRYPRMIHAEVMTHRMFSRNASSTRAIPTAKMIEWIERDPAMPVYWGKNQKGMQATEELSEGDRYRAEQAWMRARDEAVHKAKAMMDVGVHKQIASRILEPWAHINVVLSGTSFDNFFALRCHKAAMPEMQVLAVKMARAYRDSTPTFLKAGWWHLPFVTPEELTPLCDLRWMSGQEYHTLGDEVATADAVIRLLKLSVARSARVSYRTFDGGEPDPDKDVILHDSLLANDHFSPFEHQGRALGRQYPNHRSGNLVGWEQYRQTLRESVHEKFDFSTLDQFGDADFIV